MPARTGTAHVVTTVRKYKDQVYRTHLLRRSYREGGKVKNETLGNLSHLPEALIDLIRRALQGETFVPLAQAFAITASRPHGHVQAVALALQRLGIAALLASKPCRERQLVLAMIAARIVAPHTKLATTRWWHTTTLAEEFGVAEATEDDLYAAMDWLLARQDRIERKLAARHLSAGSLVLYDLSSSYFEGSTCPLAKLGYSRDGKPGLPQVNYGLLTDARGCPIAVSVHDGNVADSQTLLPAVQRLRADFGIEQLVLVGDRGMIANKAIEVLRQTDGIGWITALKSASIRALVEQGQLQLGLFDERNLLELQSPDYPGERLVACRNPELARLRAYKREELLAATERNLEKIQARVVAGKLSGAWRSATPACSSRATPCVSPPRRPWTASISSVPRSVPAAWMPLSACATTRRWPTSSGRSARSRRSISKYGRSTIGWRIGCAPTSSCACSPTTSSGTCARPGASCCSPIPIRPPRPTGIR
jgi:hypothetical protein